MGTNKLVISATFLSVCFLAAPAYADTFDFSFVGPGVSGSIELTYGGATDLKYPGQAYEVTGISGTFSDTNNGLNIMNASAGPLEALTYSTPEPDNTVTPPHDFSRYAVASGLSADGNVLTFDNLYWPGGSPQTADTYPPHGGFLDIYGLMFDIGNGQVVDIWSNGDSGSGVDYGVAVATSATALDYVGGGVSITPEPGALGLIGGGLLGLATWRMRASRRRRTS